MKPRFGFVIEQALGHVAYGSSLRRVIQARDDIETEWLEIPFAESELSGFPLSRAVARVHHNWTLRGSYRAHRAIAEAHARRPFDALFIHTQTIALFARNFMRRVPTVLSLDATPRNYDEVASWYGDRVHAPAVEALKLAAHRHVMSAARKYTVWSEWTKRSLVQEYGARERDVFVLHPGTDLGVYPDGSRRGPRAPGPLRVMFVGGDFVRKGGDLLLKVFRERLSDVAELHLVTSASAQVAESPGVHVYTGVKPHSELLLRLYAQADVFVLPTRADCLAVVLGEAMACGLPIITTRVGAHAEAVKDGETGYLIDIDAADALADRLLRLAADPALAAELGRKARARGEQLFDVRKNADEIARTMLEIARPREARSSAGSAR
jgi:glycosyltransferase involved in cell wall biosynthesis